MSIRGVLVVSALALPLLLLLAGTSAAEQATCRMIWLAKMPCSISLSALINQVKVWSKDPCSDPQEKCMYELLAYSPKALTVKHMTPMTDNNSTISFFFSSSAPPVTPVTPAFCRIMAISISNATTPKPNDYCLIYNLMDGSGLTQIKGAKEICTVGMCPSVATATCRST